ncbi:hypothetical protein F4803DRAFT_498026 [Xylaria telfairii]|nr:hypothetical protein F4803DRAFT_498026 [Xylaria telfairii]
MYLEILRIGESNPGRDGTVIFHLNQRLRGSLQRIESREKHASAVNRTRGPSMATMDFTTKPLMLVVGLSALYSRYTHPWENARTHQSST